MKVICLNIVLLLRPPYLLGKGANCSLLWSCGDMEMSSLHDGGVPEDKSTAWKHPHRKCSNGKPVLCWGVYICLLNCTVCFVFAALSTFLNKI